jgi:hypothetical protein
MRGMTSPKKKMCCENCRIFDPKTWVKCTNPSCPCHKEKRDGKCCDEWNYLNCCCKICHPYACMNKGHSTPKTEEKAEWYECDDKNYIGQSCSHSTETKCAHSCHEHKTEGWEGEFQTRLRDFLVQQLAWEKSKGIFGSPVLQELAEKKYNDLQSFIASLILKAKEEGRTEWENINKQYQSRQEAFEAGGKSERERILAALAPWIDDNIGTSSTAIYLYMSVGLIPGPFEAPHDSDDRDRCLVLLEAVPEFIPRLSEIENIKICGLRNRKLVYPWREQIPLLRAALEQEKKDV